MGEEEIEQNVGRLKNFLFHILGCGEDDAKKIIHIFIRKHLSNGKNIESEEMRDKSHMESVERWAEFVRTQPKEEWKPRLDLFIDGQYEKARAFYERLGKSAEGRKILERLKKLRMEKGK